MQIIFIDLFRRHRVLEDIKVVPVCDSLIRKSFRFDILRIETDNPSFENFERLFDDENDEDAPDFPDIDCDWRRKFRKCFLLSLEAGVLVITFDVSQFVRSMTHRMILHLSYVVKNELEDSRLVINVGNLSIESDSIFGNDLDVLQWRTQKYKNLLALTSVSECVSMKISIRHDLKKLLKFFADLKLEIINESSNEDNFDTQVASAAKPQHFLYCSHGYFNGVLIRMKNIKDQTVKAKVYVR